MSNVARINLTPRRVKRTTAERPSSSCTARAQVAHLFELQYQLADGLLGNERAGGDLRHRVAAQIEICQHRAVGEPYVGISTGPQLCDEAFVEPSSRPREQLPEVDAAAAFEIIHPFAPFPIGYQITT